MVMYCLLWEFNGKSYSFETPHVVEMEKQLAYLVDQVGVTVEASKIPTAGTAYITRLTCYG